MTNFHSGSNFLSDQNWKMDAFPWNMAGNYPYDVPSVNSAYLDKDYRGAPTPLIIGGTTYAKGFCFGIGNLNGGNLTTNGWFRENCFGATNLSGAWGKQQAWDGGTFGIRLTIYTNNVQVWQSGFVTNNTTDATNFNLNITAASDLMFYVDASSSGSAQGVIGNAVVVVPDNSGYATTAFVTSQGFVTSAVTNGLATTNYVNTATNSVVQTTDSRVLALTNANNQFAGTFIPTTNVIIIDSSKWIVNPATAYVSIPNTINIVGLTLVTNAYADTWFNLLPDNVGVKTNLTFKMNYWATNNGAAWPFNLGLLGQNMAGNTLSINPQLFTIPAYTNGWNTFIFSLSVSPYCTNMSYRGYVGNSNIPATNTLWLVSLTLYAY